MNCRLLKKALHAVPLSNIHHINKSVGGFGTHPYI